MFLPIHVLFCFLHFFNKFQLIEIWQQVMYSIWITSALNLLFFFFFEEYSSKNSLYHRLCIKVDH